MTVQVLPNVVPVQAAVAVVLDSAKAVSEIAPQLTAGNRDERRVSSPQDRHQLSY